MLKFIGVLKGFMGSIFKHPVKSLLIVSVIAGVILFGLWQNAKLDGVQSDLEQTRAEKIKAEKRAQKLSEDIQEMQKHHETLKENNRKINKELSSSKSVINAWQKRYQEAVENPEQDSKDINLYFDNLFDEFECITGDCND